MLEDDGPELVVSRPMTMFEPTAPSTAGCMSRVSGQIAVRTFDPRNLGSTRLPLFNICPSSMDDRGWAADAACLVVRHDGSFPNSTLVDSAELKTRSASLQKAGDDHSSTLCRMRFAVVS